MRLLIVIPTLDEEGPLRLTLPQAMAVADEVCVSDGGSRDRTLAVARDLGARVVAGPAGRGAQLNRGVAGSTCEVFLFLHADTSLPAGARELILRAVAGGASGGGFRLRYDSPRASFAVGSQLATWRSRITRRPLGDQAQFAARSAFEAVGGFPDWPILEDLELMRRIAGHGRIVHLPAAVTTSARRFERLGTVRTVLTNYLIWGLFLAGVHPRRLAR